MIGAISESRLRRRDEFLDGAAADLLAYDRRLCNLDVDVSFDRGVAHITGVVSDTAELALLRTLIGRLDGVLAVWDRVQVGGRDPMILDLGCGDTVQYADNIGFDCRQTDAVSAIADVSRELPIRTGSADAIFVVHILEHLPDYLPLLDECHRVLRAGGVLHLMTPWWRHVNAVADPTHVRLFDVQTVKSLCLRSASEPRWTPLHVACDGASVFADLRPCQPGEEPDVAALGRFFD